MDNEARNGGFANHACCYVWRVDVGYCGLYFNGLIVLKFDLKCVCFLKFHLECGKPSRATDAVPFGGLFVLGMSMC